MGATHSTLIVPSFTKVRVSGQATDGPSILSPEPASCAYQSNWIGAGRCVWQFPRSGSSGLARRGRADGTSLPHQRATLGRRSPVDRLAGATTTRDTRPASQTRHAGSLPPSLLFPDGREHGWIATIFKRPFPIPLQLVVPQVLARMSLDEWHEELARHIAQALQ